MDGSCFFTTWFLLSVNCVAPPWPCVALCRCPGHCLSSGPLTRTSEHFTAFMAHTSLPCRWHLVSGHLNSPFKENKTQWERILRPHQSESTWLWLLHQSAVTIWERTLIEFELAWKTQQTTIWMFTFENPWRGQELEYSHVSVCRIQCQFQILYCFFSEVHLSSGRRQSACLFVYRALSPLSTSRMHPSISHHYPPPLPTYQFTQFTKSRPSYLLSKYYTHLLCGFSSLESPHKVSMWKMSLLLRSQTSQVFCAACLRSIHYIISWGLHHRAPQTYISVFFNKLCLENRSYAYRTIKLS